MKFNKIPQKTQKIWFWEVRGRNGAQGPLKYLWITAVFTRRRKGAICLGICKILVNSGISVNLWEITKFREITLEFGKSAFCTNPWPFTKRLFFLGQIDAPEPWDHQNLEITRIPLNLMKFHHIGGIMLNCSGFSRIPLKISFWAIRRAPGGPMLKTLIFL